MSTQNEVKLLKKIEGKNLFNFEVLKNLVPGTLFYNGNKNVKFEIEIFSYSNQTYSHKFFKDFESFSNDPLASYQNNENILWLNITGLNHVDKIRAIGKHFDISELVLEQILTITKHSNYKVNPTYVFNDLQMANLEGEKVKLENISIFFKDNLLLTFQEEKGDVFDSIRDRIINKTGYIRSENSGYLYYSLLDAIVDHYLAVIDYIKYKSELVEENSLTGNDMSLKDLHQLRKYIMILKFNCVPIEKVVELYYKNHDFLKIKNSHFIDNLYEHTKLLNNEVSLQREIISNIHDNYMLYNGNEMNKIMTTLAIFSAVFIPLSFVAGVFGMNFINMPGLSNPNGFYYFLLGCFLSTIVMVGFFKHKKWF